MNRSAKLISDQAYISAHESLSSFPYYYYTDHVPNRLEKQFPGSCPAFAGGCKQFNVNGASVNTYNDKIIPGKNGWTRVQPSASTQIFGGPFKARGDGALTNPDSLSRVWTPQGGYAKHCSKRLSEVTYDTWLCHSAPNQSEDVFDLRGGVSARQGLQFISGC